MESDGFAVDNELFKLLFLSTLSAWRATKDGMEYCIVRTISIHALRMESDRTGWAQTFAI